MLGELEKIRGQVRNLCYRVQDMRGITLGSERTAWNNMYLNLNDILHYIDTAQDLADNCYLRLPKVQKQHGGE